MYTYTSLSLSHLVTPYPPIPPCHAPWPRQGPRQRRHVPRAARTALGQAQQPPALRRLAGAGAGVDGGVQALTTTEVAKMVENWWKTGGKCWEKRWKNDGNVKIGTEVRKMIGKLDKFWYLRAVEKTECEIMSEEINIREVRNGWKWFIRGL